MSTTVEILIGLAAIIFLWWLIRRFFLAPSEPRDYAGVPAPRRRNPKDRSGAVAVEEPEDDD